MSQHYLVWLKENGQWVEQGDGEMTLRTAERVAREIEEDFHCQTRVLPVGHVTALTWPVKP